MNRRSFLTSVPSLSGAIIYRDAYANSVDGERRKINDARDLRASCSFSEEVAKIGMKHGDRFLLPDGSCYEVSDKTDFDLPLPGDALNQYLKVVPVMGEVHLSSWGIETQSPERGGGDRSKLSDSSEALRRAVMRSLSTWSELILPPGVIRIEQPGALLGRDIQGRHEGLIVTGSGSNRTVVIYDPPDCVQLDAPLMENINTIIGIRISKVRFHATKNGRCFSRMFGNGVSQDHRFSDVAWTGRWSIGIELISDPDSGFQGNNNSEFIFDGVYTGVFDERFILLLGGASDQNLNYWFNNCRLWGDVTIAKMLKGGHVHIANCDVSGYQPREPQYLFELLGGHHARGVCSFSIRGLRVEAKNENALLIKSNWSYGNVEIMGLDMSSQTPWVRPRLSVINLEFGRAMGPIFSISDSQIMGDISVSSMGAGRVKSNSMIKLSRCTFYSKSSPDQVFKFPESNGDSGLVDIIFESCRSSDDDDIMIWDCNLGYLLGGNSSPMRRYLPIRGNFKRCKLPKGAVLLSLLEMRNGTTVSAVVVDSTRAVHEFGLRSSYVCNGEEFWVRVDAEAGAPDSDFIMEYLC